MLSKLSYFRISPLVLVLAFIVKRLGPGLGTGIGDWDWGLGLGTGIGDWEWGMGE